MAVRDRTGEQFGEYRLIRKLGQGGFAEVYLGEHVHLQTRAAVKLLLASVKAENEQQFLEEAQKVARLDHPHIVRVLDYSVQQGVPFLVMQYAPGGALSQRHSGNTPLPLETILPSVQQVAEALQYAHDQRVIHLDVKPANMLLDGRGNVLLADFGIALALAHTRTHQTLQNFSGTLIYSAPEQLQFRPGLASDQYALATTVYRWLTGVFPFQAGDYIGLGLQKLQNDPPPLRVHVPTLSPAVEQAVLRALAKDPGARFASVRAFAEALSQTHWQFTPTVPVTPQLPLPTTLRATVPPAFLPLASPAQQASIPPQPPAGSFNPPTSADHVGWSTSPLAPVYPQPGRVTGPVPSWPMPSPSSQYPVSGDPGAGLPRPLPSQPAVKKSRSGVSRALRLLGVLLVCLFLLAWCALALLAPSDPFSPTSGLLSPGGVLFLGPAVVSGIGLLVSTLRATTTRTSRSNMVGVIAGLIGALLLVVLIRASPDTVPNAVRVQAAALQLIAWIGLAGICLGILGALLP